MSKRVTVILPDEVFAELDRIRRETGAPISAQIVRRISAMTVSQAEWELTPEKVRAAIEAARSDKEEF